jgi:hypothetical protein
LSQAPAQFAPQLEGRFSTNRRELVAAAKKSLQWSMPVSDQRESNVTKAP